MSKRAGFLGLGAAAGAILLVGAYVVVSSTGKVAHPAQEAGTPWFEDVTERVGLDFVHEAGPVGDYFMPQIMGSGAALFDFDNDGRLDIFLIQNAGPKSQARNRLYHQEPDGHFKDVTAGSGLDVAGYGMGVAVGDVNNDGLPDLLVTEYGRIRLFLNLGRGKFRDVTAEAGLDNPLWATSACFFDYDRDGWLDLAVVNYLDYDPSLPCHNVAGRRDYCHPSTFPGRVTKLFHNLGSKGGPGRIRFEDVTLKSGLGRVEGPGLGIVCADFDGDRWPDIFVANDSKPNHLWINQRDGTFKEEAVSRGVAFNRMGNTEANMGVAVGDVDGDGLFDLFVTHLVDENHTLWRQGPRGFFQDQTAKLGLAQPAYRGTGFGTALGDFDNDGALDLAVVNGRVMQPKSGVSENARDFWSWYSEQNQLFANQGDGNFRDVSADNPPFCGRPAVGRGLAWGDIDNDGGLDLLVSNIAGPARLYRNVAAGRGHWLRIRAFDPALRRDAYGAEITVVADRRRWWRLANPGQSYLSSSDPRVHFGLGQVTNVDRIEVTWPDGSEEIFPGVAADQGIELRKGQGRPRKEPKP